MRIKTSELDGAALDWAVAEVVGVSVDASRYAIAEFGSPFLNGTREAFSPSRKWSQGGPLISDHVIMLQHTQGAMIGDSVGEWMATATYDDGLCLADTALIAACRAIVVANLGDEVDVPEELLC